MAKIVWQTEYKELIDAFQNKNLPSDSRGGFIYEYNAASLLSDNHNLIMDNNSYRKRNERGTFRHHKQTTEGSF